MALLSLSAPVVIYYEDDEVNREEVMTGILSHVQQR